MVKSDIKKNFNEIFLLSLGTIPGALLRWQIGNYFISNLIGTFILGFIIGLPLTKKNKLILSIGFCGSLTTFSGWMLESSELILQGYIYESFSQIIYMLTIGFFMGVLGRTLSSYVLRLERFR